MDTHRFDELTKAVATATSRRQALKTIAATALGSILGLGGIGTAFAKCKPNGIGCNINSQCCSGGCCRGTCTDLSSNLSNCGSCGHACRSDQVCSGGMCVCPSGSQECNGTCCNTSDHLCSNGTCQPCVSQCDETCSDTGPYCCPGMVCCTYGIPGGLGFCCPAGFCSQGGFCAAPGC